MQLLWPDGILFENVLLLVMAAASYLKQAATSLQILYSNMIYLPCLCPGLHRIAEEIRLNFSSVEKLISNVNFFSLRHHYELKCSKTQPLTWYSHHYQYLLDRELGSVQLCIMQIISASFKPSLGHLTLKRPRQLICLNSYWLTIHSATISSTYLQTSQHCQTP